MLLQATTAASMQAQSMGVPVMGAAEAQMAAEGVI